VVLALAALALPPISTSLARRLRPPLQRAAPVVARIPAGLWILLLVSLAWVWRGEFTIGDGAQTVALLEGGELINTKEPLDRLLTAAVYRLGRWLIGWDAATAIAVVSTAAGAAFWLAVRRLGRRFPFAVSGAWPWWWLMGTTGATALFCGHVENYSLLTAGALWTLTVTLEVVDEPARPLWPAALVLGLTVAVHLAAVWLAPAVVVAWVARWRSRLPGARELGEAVVGLAVSLLPLGFVALGLAVGGVGLEGFSAATFGGGDGRLFVPWAAVETAYERYTMLSLAHLAAFANQVLLVTPVGLILACAAGVGRRAGERRAGAAGLVLLAAAAGTVLYAFLFNPDMMVFYPSLGPLAEWDLFAFAAIPVTLLGAWTARVAWPASDSRSGALVAAAAVSAAHGLLWVAFNAVVTL